MTFLTALKIIVAPAARTLIQLAAVLGLVICFGGIVFGFAAGSLRDPDRSRYLFATFEVAVLQDGVEHYRADCGQYPSSRDGLNALVRNSGVGGWHGPYVAQVPIDPWKRQFIYSYPPASIAPEMISYGADQKPGGEYFNADISSRNLWRSIPETRSEVRARYIVNGLWVAAWLGFVGSAIALVKSSRRQPI